MRFNETAKKPAKRTIRPQTVLSDTWTYVKENDQNVASIVATIPWGFLAFIHVPAGITLTMVQGFALFYSMFTPDR